MDALLSDRLDLTSVEVRRGLFLFEEMAAILTLDDDSIERLHTARAELVTPISKTHLRVERIVDVDKLHLKVAHFEHTPTRTHILAFSDVKSFDSIKGGVWRVPCSKKLVPFAKAVRGLGRGLERAVDVDVAPKDASISAVALRIASEFLKHDEFVEMLRRVGPQERVVVCGFSLGGFLTHTFSSMLRLWRTAPKGRRMVVVVGGAPRTGNAAWARWFNTLQPTERFAHFNLVFREDGRVDPVTTFPCSALGFANCEPILFSDGHKVVVDMDSVLSTVNFAGRTSQFGMCLSSVRFLNGFGPHHRPALVLDRRSWNELKDDAAEVLA